MIHLKGQGTYESLDFIGFLHELCRDGWTDVSGLLVVAYSASLSRVCTVCLDEGTRAPLKRVYFPPQICSERSQPASLWLIYADSFQQTKFSMSHSAPLPVGLPH